jgi:hypothetical protein
MNKSKIYLLPLFISTLKINKEFVSQIKNTYLLHDSHLIDKCIGISFKSSILKNPKYIEHIQNLILDDAFIEIDQNSNEILYLFEFPEKYFPEYFKFVKGKYSQFSRRAKEIILRFWTETQITDKQSIYDLIYIKQVLFKDEKLRLKLEEDLDVRIEKGQELGSIVDLDNEKFTNKEMKESVEIHE